MLYLTCTMISSVDLAHYGVSRVKDWVSVDYGTKEEKNPVCKQRRNDAISITTSCVRLTFMPLNYGV